MEKLRKGESQKREDARAQKGKQVAKLCVFTMFVAPEGRQVGSVRSQLAG